MNLHKNEGIFLWFWIKVLRYIFITVFVLIIAFIAVLIVTHKQSVKKEKVIVEKYFETHYGDTDYVIDKIFDNYPISGVVAYTSSSGVY